MIKKEYEEKMFDEIMQEIEDNFDLKYDICGAYLDNKCEISDDFFEMASDREIGFYIIKLKKLLNARGLINKKPLGKECSSWDDIFEILEISDNKIQVKLKKMCDKYDFIRQSITKINGVVTRSAMVINPTILKHRAHLSSFCVSVFSDKIKLKNKIYGYVYIIEAEDGRIKIGMTYNLNKRLNTISTATGLTIPRGKFLKTKKCSQIEKKALKLYSEFRTKGEWFSGLKLEDIDLKEIHDGDWKSFIEMEV